jgi:hypothetical protein
MRPSNAETFRRCFGEPGTAAIGPIEANVPEVSKFIYDFVLDQVSSRRVASPRKEVDREFIGGGSRQPGPGTRRRFI